MKKKRSIIIIIVIILILLISILFGMFFNNKKDDKVDEIKKSDAIKIKEEYESLNGKESTSGKVYPKVTLKENNAFRYATSKEIVEKIENGTGLIYLGFKQCPWCRNAINVLDYINTSEILYLDMLEERDKYEVVDGKLVKTENGTEEYKKLLTLLDSILDDYVVEDENGNKFNIEEKRIYVPLVIGVKNGKIVGYHSDTVDLNEGQSPFDLLDEKQQSKLKLIYEGINSKVFGDTCDLDGKSGC